MSFCKHKLKDDQLESSSSLAEKLKPEMKTFKLSGNQKQLKFNTETFTGSAVSIYGDNIF